MSEEEKAAWVGQKRNCAIIAATPNQGGSVPTWKVDLEIQDQLFPDDMGVQLTAMFFQEVVVGKAYQITFSLSAKTKALVGKRPASTEEEKAERARLAAEAKEKERQRALQEKADYEADQKKRGLTDAHPPMAGDSTPSANLIPQTSANQVLLAKKFGFGDEDVRIMEQNNIVPNGTPIHQVEFFFRKAQLQNLNPLLGQIYLLPFGPASNRSYATVSAIDSLRARALESKEYGGCTKVLFDGLSQSEWVRQYENKRTYKTVEIPKSGGGKQWTEKEQHLESGEFPQIASITVTRMLNGTPCQFEAEIQWDEYYPGPSGRGQMWRDRPFGQLGKCVEAIALRKAFADHLSKMHIPEELDRKAAQEEATDATFEVFDMHQVITEIQNLHTVEDLQRYKVAHPELAKDGDFLLALSERHKELTTDVV